MMEEAIADFDAPKFKVLNETDKGLLSLLSSEHPFTLDDILDVFKGEEGRDAVRKRLDGLVTSGLVKKDFVKSGRAYKVTYAVSKTVAKIWAKRFSS
jgi:predicted transcriptional regulator